MKVKAGQCKRDWVFNHPHGGYIYTLRVSKFDGEPAEYWPTGVDYPLSEEIGLDDPDTEVTLLDDRGKVWAECAAAIRADIDEEYNRKTLTMAQAATLEHIGRIIDRIAQQPPLPGGGE